MEMKYFVVILLGICARTSVSYYHGGKGGHGVIDFAAIIKKATCALPCVETAGSKVPCKGRSLIDAACNSIDNIAFKSESCVTRCGVDRGVINLVKKGAHYLCSKRHKGYGGGNVRGGGGNVEGDGKVEGNRDGNGGGDVNGRGGVNGRGRIDFQKLTCAMPCLEKAASAIPCKGRNLIESYCASIDEIKTKSRPCIAACGIDKPIVELVSSASHLLCAKRNGGGRHTTRY